MKKLTPKQEIFCKEYIIDFNGARAAKDAGYSKKTARQTANEILTKPYIQEFVQQLIKKREERTEITGDMVIQELAKTAFIKESDFYNDDGSVKKLSELTDAQKAGLSSYTIKSVSVGGGEYEDIPIFKTQDKTKSLELLGKHLALFTDVKKLEGGLTITKGLNDYYDEADND